MQAARQVVPPTSQIFRKKFLLKARSFSLALGDETKIMGVMNLTPDSFSGDGLLKSGKFDPRKSLAVATELIQGGADIIDIGGESTRPGALTVDEKEEIQRVIPTVDLLTQKIQIPISVDTYKENVAKHALDAGASIINNIMGIKATTKFLKMVRNYNAAIVLMHIRGTPRTMQRKIHYTNLMGEIISHLRKSIEKCLEIGIKSDKIIIDPGVGFGKTVEHNLEILARLGDFRILNQPILIGPSRKSFIGKILGKEPSQRLSGTIAAVCAGILNGAHIIRVHDIREVKDAVTLIDAIQKVNFFQPNTLTEFSYDGRTILE